MSDYPSVRPHGTTRFTRETFTWIWRFEYYAKISPENFSLIKIWQEKQVFYIMTCAFMLVTRWILRMGNVLDQSCREYQNTHFMFNKAFKNCAVWNIMRKHIAELGMPQTTIWCKHISCWWLRLQTHSEYVTLSAFPRQQELRESASVLPYRTIPALLYSSTSTFTDLY
jgi:hypothetical protein